jgi:RNA polymerase sigma factor FliA
MPAMTESNGGAALRQQVELGKRADDLGPITGLTDEQLLGQYGPFMRRIVRDVGRMCSVRDSQVHEDMTADASLGLLSAARAYEVRGGARFSTYAYYRIKGAIVDGLRKSGFLRRRSRARAAVSMGATLLREAQADEPNVRPDYSLRLDRVDRTVVSTGMAWLLVQTTAVSAEQSELALRPAGKYIRAETAAILAECLMELPEQERAVLISLYYKERTLAEFAADTGRSRSWGCRLHARALDRLSGLMKARQ